MKLLKIINVRDFVLVSASSYELSVKLRLSILPHKRKTVIPSDSMTAGFKRNVYCKICDKILKLSEASFIITCVGI